MNEVDLLETLHPTNDRQAAYESLVGIDELKRDLLDELFGLLGSKQIEAWARRHHRSPIALTQRWRNSPPLVLLAGDVGCGKSALAASVGSPLARLLDTRVVALETPSDLRGWGHVGEMSARITDAFDKARKRATSVGAGLLVIDEADDIATSRSQGHAHHEDRAGLNVLIKQIDQLARAKDPLVVLLITNRDAVLDPAIRRRTGLHLTFKRPDKRARAKLFESLLGGVPLAAGDIARLVKASERDVPYSSSDLVDRLARATLRHAQRHDVPVSVDLVLECLAVVEPSPLMLAEGAK